MSPNPGQTMDRLSPLFERFRVNAHLFHAGALCGTTHFDAKAGRGFLHVLRRGEMVLTHRPRSGVPRKIKVVEPTLLFYPQPLDHQFHSDLVEGADFVCATLDFEGGNRHPVVAALPAVLVLPLRSIQGLEQTLALLFAETEHVRCGQPLLANRLFEVLLLQLLRWLLDHPDEAGITGGTICGLAHPKLSRTLTAIHESPGGEWALGSMADTAGMSRSAFAAEFKSQVGVTPAEYLLQWRVSLAQSMFLSGESLKVASEKLGYASAASFSRAFAQSVGESPSAWLQTHKR
ncbi:MAG: AraC family transcriptional regulator [Ramlibacter sp.]|nr:AraC family transcriptional regulator [Ramlibacter sp.]